MDTRPSAQSDVQPEASSRSNAWATLYRTVRDMDEGKVRDCKEEMDSLLTFAGLYSAVQTAFLIESYKNLRQDPQAVVIDLLQQLTAQTRGYTVTGPFVNATSIPGSALPDFHAAAPDIRVNVCWFASLILSLATASFSILVKQWLREYLAMDRISPQELLRIRHLRHHGLEEWQLYEIAAALPFLLQLSLAVFFVGLCFFTASVHQSVAITSLCFVSAWAFFLAATLLAPIFSPLCPYKTTFLKFALNSLRPRVRGLYQALATTLRKIAILLRAHTTVTTLRQLIGRGFNVGQLSFVWIRRVVPRRLSGPVAATQQLLAAAIEKDELGLVLARLDDGRTPYLEPFTKVKARADSSILTSLLAHTVDEDLQVWEEEEVRRTDKYDLVILTALDLTLVDEGLTTIMREALQQRPLSGEQTIQLAFGMLGRRVTLSEIADGSSMGTTLDLRSLSRATCLSLANIIADRLLLESQTVAPTQWSQSPWIIQALLFLVSLSPPNADSVPAETARAVFQKLLFTAMSPSPDGCALLALYVAGASEVNAEGHGLSRVLVSILTVLGATSGEAAARAFKYIIHWHCFDVLDNLDDDTETFTRFLQQLSEHQEFSYHLAPSTLVVMVQSAATLLYNSIEKVDSTDATHVMAAPLTELLDFVLAGVSMTERLFPDYDFTENHIPGAIILDRLFTKLFTTPSFLPEFFESMLQNSDFVSSSTCQNLLLASLDKLYLPEARTIQILAACAKYFYTKYTGDPSRQSLLAVLRLCKLVYLFGTAQTPNIIEQWHKVFNNIASILKDLQPSLDDPLPFGDATEIRQTAYDILQLVDQDDRLNFDELEPDALSGTASAAGEDVLYDRWKALVDPAGCQCPDAIIELLSDLSSGCLDAEGRMFWRPRRVREGSSSTGNAASHGD